MLLARTSHPGHATHMRATSTAVVTSTASSEDDDNVTVVPQVSTHVS
jgi:hypothetical protein